MCCCLSQVPVFKSVTTPSSSRFLAFLRQLPLRVLTSLLVPQSLKCFWLLPFCCQRSMLTCQSIYRLLQQTSHSLTCYITIISYISIIVKYIYKLFFASKLTVEMETVACLFPPSKVWVITPHCPIILCITTQYRVSHRLLETHTLAHRVTVFYFLQKEYVLQATYLSQYYLQQLHFCIATYSYNDIISNTFLVARQSYEVRLTAFISQNSVYTRSPLIDSLKNTGGFFATLTLSTETSALNLYLSSYLSIWVYSFQRQGSVNRNFPLHTLQIALY